MTTPAKPRPSAIPTPGRVSAIPTPGSRSRSSSNVHQSKSVLPPNDDISRALAEAIKANDPSHHRPIPLSATSSTSSLSPQTISHSLSSGRRSVAGRPSSAASTSSAKVPDRAKTPALTRPVSRSASRQSDASSRLSRTFEVGENVRIESLGFEGALRYIGEIDGKPGLWAGVELSGGFSGKGKNDGSVAGKQYFSCPEKCGVFVATTKLSPPTVGPGAVRPSSVASSRGGRTTPALSGRTTPSFSIPRTPSASFLNGRVTPSTAGRTTPGTGVMTRRTFKTPTPKISNGASLTDKITAGSRAAKYMNMTAQQLSSRDLNNGTESPTRKSNGTLPSILPSPTISRTLSSPSRPSGSPFSTPRAGSGRFSGLVAPNGSPSLPSSRSRPAASTPRPRIPSAVAMPPPPSPKIPQQQFNEATSASDVPSTIEVRHKTHARPYSRPSSSASIRSTATDEVGLVEQLRSRLDALEYENERLRTASETQPAEDSARLEQLQSDKQKAINRATELEANLAGFEQNLKTREDELQKLVTQNLELTTQLNDATSEVQRSLACHEQEKQAHYAILESLRDQLQELERLNSQKDERITEHSSDIEALRGDLERAYAELEEDRKELGAQIDELRIAGQETIALYEERLSGAKSEQYELEQRIATLDSRLRVSSDASVQEQVSQRTTTSAAQIDNETLRDQVQHLQKRSAKLEEQLEDARASLERDVSTYQEKIGRIRMEEEQRKRDLLSKSREVEQLIMSEARARGRVDEIEEALRESTVALENARGEVETLRAELANLDVLIDDTTEGDITSRLASFVKRAASERTKHQQEINRLEEAIKHSRRHPGNIELLKAENEESKEQIINLQSRVSVLMQTIDDRTSEIETLRKKANREVSLSNGILESKSHSPKSESCANREEVAGLKHIVQELQKENLAATQRIKLLETENQLLSAEAAQLREEVNILEDNMNNSLLETDTLSDSPNDSDIGVLRRQMKEQQIRLETELDQMRKKLNETEMKNARVAHDLNKEISELETLVESKIYREDELEQEVERLKDKLARYKKSSKNTTETPEGRSRLSSSSTSTINLPIKAGGDDVCEICERPGHDIFNCSLLKEDVRMPMKTRSSKELFCQDCESPGHTTADCPHSLDVF